MYYFCMKLLKHYEYQVNTADTGGLMVEHQSISSYSGEYAPMRFQ